MIIPIIGLIICTILLSYITSKEKWDNATRPPKGWGQHKGIRFKLPKR